MGWFGLKDDDYSDEESDPGSLQEHYDNNSYSDPDVETGAAENYERKGEPSVPFAEAMAASLSLSPLSTTDSTSGLSDGPKAISFRPLKSRDRAKIQQLHEEWFPVRYSDEFYSELCNHHRLSTSGDNLFTCVATLNHDEGRNNMYCQQAGASMFEAEDEIIGCVVGSFLHRSRLSVETANLILPHAERHSRMFYIMTLGTAREYRKLGVASLLIEQIMEEVEADVRCGAVYLHVLPLNTIAIHFYEKHGFYRVCTIPDYYIIDNIRYDCYLYAKYLHGNHGHRNLYTIVTGAISSMWKQIKSFAVGSQ